MRKLVEYVNKHKIVTFLAAFSVLALVLASNIPVGTFDYTYGNQADEASGRQFVDQTGVEFTSWDTRAATTRMAKHATKPYTIMIYMNGSDLESETGAGTYDLSQMLDSGLDSKNANLLVFTGGTNRWQNDVIPSNSCVIWKLADGTIEPLVDVGLRSMGNPGTLAGFIEYSMTNFPAEKYGLIMWDHGGGSIAGYGHDEKFNNATLTLADMDRAFFEAGLDGKQLEFLGFDSCLMSSVEMAIVASNYAKYMIASEDLSPGEGWNYYFLEVLNEDPYIDGASLGIEIVDYYMDYFGEYEDDILNITVVDLENVDKVMTAMGRLMSRCNESLMLDRAATFTALARRRGNTRTFGEGTPRDNESDMVDIGDMAFKLYDLYPREAEEVFTALDESVIYNRNNSGAYLSGLSTYYVYGGRHVGKEALEIYSGLNMDDDYTGYLHRFFNNLVRGGGYYRSSPARSELSEDEVVRVDLTVWKPDGEKGRYFMTGIRIDEAPHKRRALWPEIHGEKVCLYKINESGENVQYAIPAELNGRDCDIVVLFNGRNPRGKILGARHSDGVVIQKGYDEMKEGDKLTFYYQTRHFSGIGVDGWRKGREITIVEPDGIIHLDWVSNDKDTFYSQRITDIWGNEHYGDLTKSP